MEKKDLYKYARIGNFAFSFGFTSITAILLGFLGGQWLDRRFSSAPIFLILGILLGVAVTFQSLFAELKILTAMENIERDEDENNKGKKK